jgi:hypothetical protein
MDEFLLAHEALKSRGTKVNPAVGDQKEQVRQEQMLQGLDHHLGGDFGTGQEDMTWIALRDLVHFGWFPATQTAALEQATIRSEAFVNHTIVAHKQLS